MVARREAAVAQIGAAQRALAKGEARSTTLEREALARWLAGDLPGLIHFMAQCGFRKAEVALASGDEFGPMHLSMANVVWRIAAASPDGPDGKHTFIACPTKEQLALLAEGDYAAVRPPPSKVDQLGLHWAADPIYLPYHATATINAARALAELEAMRGVAPEARRSSPLFTDGSGKPFTHGSLDALLHGLLLLCGMSDEEAQKYSWHSFRSFLACSLLAAGKDAATIQCLLRWKTAEALALYARINLGAYGGGGTSSTRCAPTSRGYARHGRTASPYTTLTRASLPPTPRGVRAARRCRSRAHKPRR